MRKLFLIVLLLAVLALGLWMGKGITYANQVYLYDALRNVSAIIFGVMGAWIAILYPDGLTSLFKLQPSDGKRYQRVKRLMVPVKYATLIVCVSLVAGFAALMLKQIPWVLRYREWWRAGSFSLLLILCLLQVCSLILTFWPFVEAEQAEKIANDAGASQKKRRKLTGN